MPMDAKDYLWFIVIGVVSLVVGGFINQLLGINPSSGWVATIIGIVIPLSIFYFLLKRFRR